MIVIALVWVAVGLGIILFGLIGTESSQNKIQQSADMLPVPPGQIELALNALIAQYGLTCSDEGYSGKTIAYKERRCTNNDVSKLTGFEVNARKEDIQKIDVISALSTPSDLDATIPFFEHIAALVFDDDAMGMA